MKNEKLAKEFSKMLREELGHEAFSEMVEDHRNKSEDDGFCVSHDYCDPNQIMADAYYETFGKYPVIAIESDDLDDMNDAWRIAQKFDFYSESDEEQ